MDDRRQLRPSSDRCYHRHHTRHSYPASPLGEIDSHHGRGRDDRHGHVVADAASVTLLELILVLANAVEVVVVLWEWHAEIARTIRCCVDEVVAGIVVVTLILE